MSSRCVVVRGKLLGERPWFTGNAEWVTVPIQETLQRVLCRTTNRIFVGVSLCSWPFSRSTIHSVACDDFFKAGIMTIRLWMRTSRTMPLKLPRSSACFRSFSSRAQSPLSLIPFQVYWTHFSIVLRLLSNVPSNIQQQVEFIRPMVEERFAKMEEYGEDWDDKPVCRTTISVPLSLDGWSAERFAHVVDERGQGCGEVRRRPGTAVAYDEYGSYHFNVFGKL